MVEKGILEDDLEKIEKEYQKKINKERAVAIARILRVNNHMIVMRNVALDVLGEYHGVKEGVEEVRKQEDKALATIKFVEEIGGEDKLPEPFIPIYEEAKRRLGGSQDIKEARKELSARDIIHLIVLLQEDRSSLVFPIKERDLEGAGKVTEDLFYLKEEIKRVLGKGYEESKIDDYLTLVVPCSGDIGKIIEASKEKAKNLENANLELRVYNTSNEGEISELYKLLKVPAPKKVRRVEIEKEREYGMSKYARKLKISQTKLRNLLREDKRLLDLTRKEGKARSSPRIFTIEAQRYLRENYPMLFGEGPRKKAEEKIYTTEEAAKFVGKSYETIRIVAKQFNTPEFSYRKTNKRLWTSKGVEALANYFDHRKRKRK